MENYYISVSQEEKNAGQLSPEHLNHAAHHFKSMGYVVLKEAYSTETIEAWKSEFIALLTEKVKRFRQKYGNQITANHDVNRWNMHIPTETDLFKGEFFANPLVLQVLTKIMGHNCFAPVFIASDIAFPNSEMQEIHQDGGDFAIAVNIPLVKVTMENGPTEIWETTHRRQTDSTLHAFSMKPMELSADKIRHIVATQPSEFITLDVGDISIRDLRMVHRGTTNHTHDPRPYLSVIYYPVGEHVPHPFLTNWVSQKAKEMRNEAFKQQNQLAIDWANAMGRLPNLMAFSDRESRYQIPKSIANNLSEAAKYMLRFAQFEEDSLSEKHSLIATFQLFREYRKGKKEFEKRVVNVAN